MHINAVQMELYKLNCAISQFLFCFGSNTFFKYELFIWVFIWGRTCNPLKSRKNSRKKIRLNMRLLQTFIIWRFKREG